MNGKRIAVFILIVLAVIGAGWIARYATSQAPSATVPDAKRRVLYWYDPMRPDVHFDKPGKSPFMDMQLVPMYADKAESSVIAIQPRMVQSLGVRTAQAVRGAAGAGTRAVGLVEIDERRIIAIEVRAAGWVERLNVRAVGEPVKQGQTVASIYSPELFAAQEELLVARRSGDAALEDAARQRLLLFGVSARQVHQILDDGRAQRGVTVVASAGGVVTELNAREGQQIGPSAPLMRVADLTKIWITIAIPESQASAVREGMRASARVAGLAQRRFEGRIEYIYPRLDSDTRTLRARVTLDNADHALKPGMYADVTLEGGGGSDALRVPSEAVIRTGTRTVVIVAEGGGRFRPVPVSIGAESGDQIEVLDGLREGQEVVVSGQFLIDSEASLRGAFNRLEGDRP